MTDAEIAAHEAEAEQNAARDKELERLAGVAADRSPEEIANGWAPLTNNEDSVALQCYLRIDVYFAHGFSQVLAYRSQDKNNDSMWAYIGYGLGTAKYPWPCNVRRAIVEAAAKIGRLKEIRQ
uniref:Uncharacterized protein n=1 Tax=Pseudomonas phage HRDY3 TaxID=3236930 RepID=A0AB39CE52_9VIRU